MKGIISLSLCLIILLSTVDIAMTIPCNNNHLKSQISPCKHQTRNIIFFYDHNQCDTSDSASKPLPSALIGINCHDCPSGSFLLYNLTKKALECNECPKDSYSIAGNFRINGAYSEWSSEALSLFKSECSIHYKSMKYINCLSMSSSSDKSYIKSGGSMNIASYGYSYMVQLSKTFTLVKPGRVWFSYKKDTINQGMSTEANGIFRFLINYSVQLEDANITSDYHEYSVNLPAGTYSFQWKYMKEVNAFQSSDMSMYIEAITVEGIDTGAIECIPCLTGNSDKGSDHCNLCPMNQYFDKTLNKCLKCPIGTHSLPNSLGESSCVQNPTCTRNDYQATLDNKCDMKTRKMKVTYQLNNNSCTESTPLKEEEIECLDCYPGQYLKKINTDYLSCEYCPLKTYSDGNNYLNCKTCNEEPKRITYYYPQSFSYFSSNNITIADDKGHIKILYDTIDSNKDAFIEAKVDRVVGNDILRPELKIRLKKGEHDISFKAINARMKIIEVHHTTTGGGYECILCSSVDDGTDINVKPETCHLGCPPGSEALPGGNGKCDICKDNYYKTTTSSIDQCIECPKLTIANPSKSNCVPMKILSHSSNKILINLEKIKTQQIKLCLMTENLCHNDFYGPLKDKTQLSLFFISPFASNHFTSTDFSYIVENPLPSFLYMLQNKNLHDSKMKNAYSLGTEIDFIKFVRGKSTRGIVMQYINGDSCSKENKQKYSSVIFIKCLKDQDDDVVTFHTPRFIKKNDCKYYFEWASKAACPLCLSNEVSGLALPCVNSQRSVYYHEGDNCILGSVHADEANKDDESEGKTDLKDLMISSEDIDIITEFNITDLMTEEENIAFSQHSSYVINQIGSEECLILYDYDRKIIYLIINIPIIYLILVLICIIVCCKYSKVKKGYHQLHESPMDSNTTREENQPHQKIELGSNSVVISSGNEPNVLEQPEIEVKIHHESK